MVPNGVDDRRVAGPASARSPPPGAGSPGTGPLVGFAGRLVYEKGVQHLVARRAPARASGTPACGVVIAGDGPYRRRVAGRGAAGWARRRRSRFAGFLGERQLPAVLAATDATVVPSLYEPFGMVALEAAAAGAPLAVAATGGLAEIVEPGVTGVTFPHSDPDALAGAVDSLLGDDTSARRVAREARAMVAERYGWPPSRPAPPPTYAAARREATAFDTRRGPVRRSATAEPGCVIPAGNLLHDPEPAAA